MASEQQSQSDAELFQLVQNGQTNFLATLYDRHAALIYGIALQVLKNNEEAEDLTQDIFLKLTKKCPYDPKRGSLRTFLAILTRSRAIDKLRSENRTQKRLQKQAKDENATLTSNTVIEGVSQTEQSQTVQTALNQLSDREKEVLKMAYYQGLSQSEIAEKLDTPLGTIKSRSRRGLLKLRQVLTDFMEKS